MNVRLTKNAKQYTAKLNLSESVIEKAAAIARADHRGYTNANDLQAASKQVVRKFYIGDKVEITAGEHQGKTLLICGKTETYVAGAIDGKTIRVLNDYAQIISR